MEEVGLEDEHAVGLVGHADVPAAVRDMWKLIDASEKNKAAH